MSFQSNYLRGTRGNQDRVLSIQMVEEIFDRMIVVLIDHNSEEDQAFSNIDQLVSMNH